MSKKEILKTLEIRTLLNLSGLKKELVIIGSVSRKGRVSIKGRSSGNKIRK